jgi:drug/metabolite transporter (DMT)-like permease
MTTGKSNLDGALLALAAMGIYATHDTLIKLLGAHYSPFQTLFFAVLFSFPMVTIAIMQDATEANLRPRHPWWVLIRTASSTLVGFTAFYAFSTLPLAETYSILFITPLLITVLAIPILGEKVRLRRWAAVLVGLIGVVVVLDPGRSNLGLGHLAALTAATFSALANVIVRKIGQDERSFVLMLYPMMSNFIVMGAILGFVYRPMPVEHIGGFALMAALGTVAGLLFIAAFKRAEAAIVAPMQYSQILWATVYGYLFFGETVEANVIIGAGIIIASGLYIVLRESRAQTSANTPVLSTMDMGRDKGTRPNAGVWARMRARGTAAR